MTDVPPWSLCEALVFVRKLESSLKEKGFHVGLLGGVLHAGVGADLDIVIYPHNVTSYTQAYAKAALLDAKMVQKRSVGQTLMTWALKGSDDSKCVEVWQTEDGKRVDIFWMA